MLLNSKSILECDEVEEELHNKEIDGIMEMINQLPNYDCAIIFTYIDILHKNKKEQIKECKLHECLEMVEYTDLKNGMDFIIDERNIMNIIVYGQLYTIQNEYHYVKIDIMPYNNQREFISIAEYMRPIYIN